MASAWTRIFIYFFWLLLPSAISQFLLAGEIHKISLPRIEHLERADLYVLKEVENPVAILVLCPGCNGNGRDLIEQLVWQKFAKKHRLGLAGLSFASPVNQLQAGKGYYYADQGSGELLLKGLNQAFPSDTPLLFYGFSGGAHFTSRFMEWKPTRVKTWCAYSAGWWSDPKVNKSMPPGIVACGDYDGSRYGASQMFFAKGRALGKPWTWVSLEKTGHEEHPKLDDFVRIYFAAILKGDETQGQWCDIDTKAQMNLKVVKSQPTLAAWLPGTEVAESWRSLHQP